MAEKRINMRNNKSRSVFWAILAAALYAISSPVSKQFLQKVDAAIMAAFLYLGAGLGMFLLGLFVPRKKEAPLTRGELPYTVGMVVLDIAAPVFLMMGLKDLRVLDLRLFKGSVKKYIKEHKPDIVLVMYIPFYAETINWNSHGDLFDFR